MKQYKVIIHPRGYPDKTKEWRLDGKNILAVKNYIQLDSPDWVIDKIKVARRL
jgi:hypothetical protein